MNEVVDRIRKQTVERDKGEPLGRTRYIVLRRSFNMDDDHIGRLNEMTLHCPESAMAFDPKEEFCNISSHPDHESARAFREWYLRVMEYGSIPMRKRATLFRNKIDRIFTRVDHRVSNATAEGVNSRIRRFVGQGYGYSNVDDFINMCLFKLGDLNISV